MSEITDFSLAGMDRRMGPDYAFYHKGQKEKLPEIYMPPRKEGAKGHFWEIGGPWSKESGDFSSTQGQVLYTPDKGFGVDRVTIIEMSNSCFSEKPEPPWHGGFRPEPASKASSTTSSSICAASSRRRATRGRCRWTPPWR